MIKKILENPRSFLNYLLDKRLAHTYHIKREIYLIFLERRLAWASHGRCKTETGRVCIMDIMKPIAVIGTNAWGGKLYGKAIRVNYV